ncbi:carbonic anhydrase 7-like isoform X1 [Mytilus galloprovincialis]|uniref:carbonic anhydrase 7-like isoform X1 n=1 Tax=Mytilus galloprovincialis TaxID=29158 RepID=UPI003F7B8EA4
MTHACLRMIGINALASILFSVCSSFFMVKADGGNSWGYQDGIPPSQWPIEYRTCGGRRQSPVHIEMKDVVLNQQLGALDLNDINVINNIRLTLKNNGHTVEVDVEGRNNLLVTGGGLPGPFMVKQFHFHWGSADNRGSEHDISGRYFPMEMHVVTYSARFKMFEEAKNSTDGLAVLAFLFDIGDHNPVFDEMIGHMNDVRHRDDHVEIQTFSLSSLFPRSTEVFYRYYGGLTTPPCYESVVWTIFQEHIRISQAQINEFRRLGDRYFRRFRTLSDNFRPTQPISGRYVYTNHPRGLQYRREGSFPRQPLLEEVSGRVSRQPIQTIATRTFLRQPIQNTIGKMIPKQHMQRNHVRNIQRHNVQRNFTKNIPRQLVQRQLTRNIERQQMWSNFSQKMSRQPFQSNVERQVPRQFVRSRLRRRLFIVKEQFPGNRTRLYLITSNVQGNINRQHSNLNSNNHRVWNRG